ncbi:hypothetical protein AC579_1808 [Pseudocercospora musae]|uniref:Uncharacterized protein n=1 Tax=Pseudocercospora musae TaxID=113226 RepID=A0A139IDK9_9PEZI|nr:hypothetical protein AC579_1808 [Pseudocercospora musae]
MAPVKQQLAVAAVSTILLQTLTPFPLGYSATIAGLWLAQWTAYTLWMALVYPRCFSKIRHLPEAPNPHFLLGQTRRIMKEPSGIPMRDWTQNVPNNGLIRYSVWFQERVLITTPAALGEVLVTKNYDFVKPWHFRHGLGRILGIGILLAEGEEHKAQRKRLSPAFSFRHVKNIYPVFWKKSVEMVKSLSTASKESTTTDEHISDTDNMDAERAAQLHERGAIDVGNWSSRATLDIIGLSGMGRDFDSLHDPGNKLNQTYKSIFNPGRAGRFLQILGIFIPFWIIRRLPIRRNQELDAASSYIKQTCRDLIAKKREAMSEKGTVGEVDILSVALESGGFSDEDLVNQMMTFLVAGHETTATAMIWAIYLLCKDKTIQDKLRDAIRKQIPNLTSEIQASDIDDCHYLQAVCSEVLRLWAPVSLTMRVTDKDTTVQGEFIPKGTTVILSPWAINTSKHLWGEDALEFKPERWLNADGKANSHGGAESNYAFLTFLHGPRSCIGQKFAVSEFACLLAAWVGRYDTSFEEGSPLAKGELEIKGGITAKPKGGLWCTLKELPGW